VKPRNSERESPGSGVMPKAVVDLLEVVEVHHQQCEPLAVGLRLGDGNVCLR
jgi:hypothetical protein